ncbi:MAG TPA: MFS transporter [Rubrobacter sp.]|nr:MFS transporter [Rubrobacter sp.]
MLATLRQRDFALLWFGGLISMMGDWAMFAALPFYAFEQTGSAFASGAVLTALTLPGLLFGTVAGVFVDRWNRKRTMVAANLLQVLVMLPLLLVRPGESLWLVYVVAFVMASVWQFVTPAENALLPSLVGADRLMVANSLNAFNDNLARIAGPALGGLMVALGGLGGVALLNSATFLLASVLMALIRSPGVAKDADESTGMLPGGLISVWREWIEGLKLVAGERRVAVLFVILGTAMLADSILSALVAPFVGGVLGAPASLFGLLLTLRGVGGLIGGVLLGYLAASVRTEIVLTLSLISIGAGTLVFAGVPLAPVSMACAVAIGIPAVGWIASQQTLLQKSVTDEYLGRVFGAFSATTALMLFVGSLSAGALGDLAGIVPLLIVSAMMYCAAGLLAVLLLRRPRTGG